MLQSMQLYLTVQTFDVHTLTRTQTHTQSPEHVLCPSSMQEGELFSRIQARGDQAFTEKGNPLNTNSAPKYKELTCCYCVTCVTS